MLVGVTFVFVYVAPMCQTRAINTSEITILTVHNT